MSYCEIAFEHLRTGAEASRKRRSGLQAWQLGETWLLRRKLGGDAANPRYIVTEPRVGYRMAAGEGTEESPRTS